MITFAATWTCEEDTQKVIMHCLDYQRAVCGSRTRYNWQACDADLFIDSIPRDILLRKLLACGITGKNFNILKNIYTSDKCKVKAGNNLSETFKINKGVRQGCILSPLLFNIFLSDLPKTLSNDQYENPKIDNDSEISCLLWAMTWWSYRRPTKNACKIIEVFKGKRN